MANPKKKKPKICKVCKSKYVIPELMGIPLWNGYLEGYCSIVCKQNELKAKK